MDALVGTRSEFVRTCIFGLIVGTVAVLVCMQGDSFTMNDALPMFALCFFIPFGWKLLTSCREKFPVLILGTPFFWLVRIVTKLLLSLLIGIPAFLYRLIRTLYAIGKIRQLKNDAYRPSKQA